MKVEQISMKKVAKKFLFQNSEICSELFPVTSIIPAKNVRYRAKPSKKKTIDKNNAEKKAIFSEHIEIVGHDPQSKTKIVAKFNK